LVGNRCALTLDLGYWNQLPFLVLITPSLGHRERCRCFLTLIITTVQCFRVAIVRDIVSNYQLPKPKLDFVRTMKQLEKCFLLHQNLSLRATPLFIGDAAEQGPLPAASNHSVGLLSQHPHTPTMRSQNSSANFFKPSSHENRVASIRPSLHDSCGLEVHFRP
jgi:hypothetical protein